MCGVASLLESVRVLKKCAVSSAYLDYDVANDDRSDSALEVGASQRRLGAQKIVAETS